MADDSTIPLQVTIGDSAGQLETLSNQLTKAFDSLNVLVQAFDKVPGGAKVFQSLTTQVGLLRKALAEPTPEVGLLNAVTRGARATALAVKEIDTQKLLTDARQIAAALRSADPERVKQAQAANQRLIDGARLQIAQLEQLAVRANAADAKRLESELARLNTRLTASVQREQRAVAQLEKLQEQQRVQAGVQSRIRSQVVDAEYAKTPQGQVASARRNLADARLNANAEEANLQAIEATKRREMMDARLNAVAEDANLTEIERTKKRELEGARLNAVAEEANLQEIARNQKRIVDDARLSAVAEEANRQAIEATKRREMMDARLNAVAEDANLTEIERTKKRELEGARLNANAENQNLNQIQRNNARHDAMMTAAESEDFRRDPTSITHAKIAQAGKSAEVTSNLATSPEYIKSLVDQELAKQNIRSQVREQTTTPKPEGPSQAERNANYRDSHYQRMFGDGGAALFQTQARLLINYAALDQLLKGLREGVTAVVEFDASLHELQAVTGVTDSQIAGLGKSVLSLASDSKFSVKQLMESAVDLAKSGLSFLEIQTSLGKIQTLATATGTSLKESTELYTSALETFKVNTSEADKITEQLVATLNSSRLNVEKLNVAFQGIGVTAKESGLGFAETTSALASLSNAGLTSGQQLSQGFRQVLVDLDAPNAKFAKRLQELHIPLSDVSVQSNGLVGVFENLKAGGFSASDAFETLGARASTAFIAMLDHTDEMKAQYQLTLQATGAITAQATATDTLQANWRRLTNTLTSLTIGASSTVLGGLKGITGGLAEAAQGANANSSALKVMFTVLTGTVVAGAAKTLLTMVTNLHLVKNAVVQATQAMEQMSGVSAGVSTTTSALTGVMRSFGVTMIAGLGIAGVIYLIDQMGEKTGDLAKHVEELKTKETESKDAYEQKSKALETVNEFLDTTIARNAKLTTDQSALNDAVLEAKNRFGNLGTSLDGLIPDYDTLISKVIQLRHEMQGAAGVDLRNYIDSLHGQNTAAGQQVQALSGASGLTKFLGSQRAFDSIPGQAVGDMYVPGPAPTSTEGLLQFGEQYYGNNPTANSALSFISGKNQNTQTAANILRDLTDKPGGLSPVQVQALKDAINGLTAQLDKQSQTSVLSSIAEQKDRVAQMTQTPSYQGAEGSVTQLKTLIGTASGDLQGGSAVDRQQRLGQLEQQTAPLLQALNTLRASFTNKADLQAFDATDVGKAREAILGKMRELQHGVGEFASTVATNEAKLSVETLNRQISEAQAELTHSTKTKKDPALEAKIKDMAQQRHDLQIKQTQSELDAQLEKAPPTSYLRDPNYRSQFLAEKTAQADAQYQQTINRSDWTKQGGPKKDINAPIPPRAENYSSDLSSQMSAINQNAATQINQANTPVKAQDTFLNAASENQQFPKAVIDQGKRALDPLKNAALGQELSTRMKQLQSLKDLQAQADADLQKNNDDFQAIASQYGISVSDAGTVGETHFANDNHGSQQHADFKAAYERYMKNLQAIPAEKDKIQAQMDAISQQVDLIKAKEDARNQSHDGNLLGAFNASVNQFDAQNGMLPGDTFKNQGDSITHVMDNLNKSTSGFFYNLVTGANRGKGAFSEFARSILSDAVRMATDKAASSLLSGLFNFAAGALGGAGGGNLAGGATAIGGVGGAGLYLGGVVEDQSHFYLGGTVPGSYRPTRRRVHNAPKYSIPKHHFAAGGQVPGIDLGRDSVHALLAPGESILNRSATSLVGPGMVNAMNRGAIMRAGSMPTVAPPRPPDMVNVYVVDKTTPPPSPTPKDMIAAITDDIMTGGQTRKLIRSVAMGQM